LLAEARSRELLALLRDDAHVVLWWASQVECQSALHRAHRAGALPVSPLREALARLTTLVEDCDLIAPTSSVRERAGRLVAAHPLRAADALQLAAALAWCDEAPRGNGFVCLDERLCAAARAEGFAVFPT
jgi:predicted nucleic acid-binding protein